MEENERIYLCLKSLQTTAQSMFFALPYEGSELDKAMDIVPGERWKMGALVDHLIWLQERASKAAAALKVP